jgi:hypothetical protein
MTLLDSLNWTPSILQIIFQNGTEVTFEQVKVKDASQVEP